VADILIRNVPDDVVAAIDERAKRVGLSRTEYLRRTLARERPTGDETTTVADFERLAEMASDVLEPDFEARAWS
jgi:uncharacterized protein (DUF2384 family)